MPRFHPLDAVAAGHLRQLGLPDAPRAVADGWVAATAEGCTLLRGLRAWGDRRPAVVVGVAPEARALLEPVVVVRAADRRDFEAVARSGAPRAAGRLTLPGAVVDLVRLVAARVDGVRVVITQREADILAYLAARPRPVTREELQLEVWGHVRVVGRSREVDMAIRRLRAKIEPKPDAPESLLTCRGDGYRLVVGEAVRSLPARSLETLGPVLLAWAFHRRATAARVGA
jgi:hypothetical protein